MIDLKQKLSSHFVLGELVPDDCDFVPPWVLGELQDLCRELLDPIRNKFGPVIIHSGWRPREHNEAVGGAKDSDHLNGRAADFHVAGNLDLPWQERTIAAYHWARESLMGNFGQIILEDHRQALASPSKLWIHISTPSLKHPGVSTDPNAVLVSHLPGSYSPFVSEGAQSTALG